jgi:hypothetical protein
MSSNIQHLSPSSDTGRLGIMHLKRYWEKGQMRKSGKLANDAFFDEWNTDNALLAALGLGIEQTIVQLYNGADSFASFEKWVETTVKGEYDIVKINAFNRFITSQTLPADTANIELTLSENDLDFWDRNGYVIIRDAVSKEDCKATVKLICDYIEIDQDDPSGWYNPHPGKQGIMVQLFQSPLLEKNRHSPKIKKAYEQLWGRKDIWVNTDRVGFNPPETSFWKFPGPRMHWDVSLQLPIPFGLQGILYLTDTASDQGAFTLVPGFHTKVEEWLNNLPPDTNPRDEKVIADLGPCSIAAHAGDFIIWHHALPHGSCANTSMVPRFVQYINYAPLDMEVREKWI